MADEAGHAKAVAGGRVAQPVEFGVACVKLDGVQADRGDLFDEGGLVFESSGQCGEHYGLFQGHSFLPCGVLPHLTMDDARDRRNRPMSPVV